VRVREVTVNYASLLLATAISGICLAATMMGFWFTAKRDSFKLTWSLGVLTLVAHVLAYTIYAENPHPVIGAFVVALLPLGLSIIHGAAHQFVQQNPSLNRVAVTSLISLGLALPPLALGYDGIAFIVQNLAAAILLSMSGHVYFSHRREAPTALMLMAGLYHLAALSFAACGLVLIVGQQWTLGGVPENWAERVNIVVAILAMTGAGALSIALDQTRLAQLHKAEAITDALTGLLNRRGLAQMTAGQTYGPFAAVAIFDLDHFKSVNDTHGHAAGDAVLCDFARILDQGKRGRDIAARLGGEEFALVMPRVTDDQAAATVRRICAMFAAETFEAKGRAFRCTASAGIVFGDDTRPGVDALIARADEALYAAKNSGRNRIEIARIAG